MSGSRLPPGFTILFGASGAGKTTLLDCLAGLQTPDDGAIVIGETVLFDSQSRRNLASEPALDWIPAAIAGAVSAHDDPAERAVRPGPSGQR